jgi:hypothetical protein
MTVNNLKALPSNTFKLFTVVWLLRNCYMAVASLNPKKGGGASRRLSLLGFRLATAICTGTLGNS